jgi:Methyltransferase domain
MLARILEPREWQMTLGERAALEGLLAALEPGLAIEIGTAQGGSLSRIAAHCREVHSFDLEHAPGRSWPANAELHTGDSHELLPELLGRLARAGRNVDFALVDGDHTTEGARRDVEDLLDSPALGRTALLLHDTLNEDVRRGFLAARLASRPEVVHLDLDFVPGHLSRGGPFAGQLWGGLGLVLVDRAGEGAFPLAEGSGPGEFEDALAVFSYFTGRRGLLGRLRGRTP